MKKLIIITLVALLAITLVACGGGDTTTETTTPAANGTTTAPVTTTVPPVTSTQDPTPNVDPSVQSESTDILNGEIENAAIKYDWKGMQVGAFENHHPALDFHWAYVLYFQECDNDIFGDLIWTPEGSTSAYDFEMNLNYKWVLTIDGKPYEITKFSIYNKQTWGYVRMDLGEDFKHNTTELNANGYHEYDIRLDIYDVSTDEVVYYAWFTDPAWNGLHEFVPPAPIIEVVDENRDPSHILIEGAAGTSGPDPIGTGEIYTNLFDYDTNEQSVLTKLCTKDNGVPITWEYSAPVTVYSYSLIGAGDDASYPKRVPVNFKLYAKVAEDSDWVLLDEQSGEALTKATNYAERNFKIAENKVDMYTYFKLEIEAEGTYQLSDIKMYTK